MDHFKTNIAFIPKATQTEKAAGIFIVAFIFIPFAIGIFSANLWLCWSLPAGVLLLFVFNLVTKGKFNHKNWIQKNFFVEFTFSGITLTDGTSQKDFSWSDMEDKKLVVQGFDGELKSSGEDSSRYNGTENKVLFTAAGTRYEFNFYLKDQDQKNALESFLQHEELSAFFVP